MENTLLQNSIKELQEVLSTQKAIIADLTDLLNQYQETLGAFIEEMTDGS